MFERSGRFGALPDAVELMGPVLLEGGRPIMQWPEGVGVGAVELLAALAAHVNQPGGAQDAEVLGDRGLIDIEAGSDV